MQRRNRINAILLALAVPLGLAVLLLPDPRTQRPPPAIAFEPSAIERIEARFPRGGETLRLQRRDDGWRLTAPVERAASTGRVARLLESLRVRTRSCYAAAEQDPGAFGLESPRAVLDLDGTTVRFGDRAGDGRRYIRARKRLCLIDDIALPMLLGGADSLAPVDAGGD